MRSSRASRSAWPQPSHRPPTAFTPTRPSALVGREGGSARMSGGLATARRKRKRAARAGPVLATGPPVNSAAPCATFQTAPGKWEGVALRQPGNTGPPPTSDPRQPPAGAALRRRAARLLAGIPRGASARSRPRSPSMRSEHSLTRHCLCCRGGGSAYALTGRTRRKVPRASLGGPLDRATRRAVAACVRWPPPAVSREPSAEAVSSHP
jgi:hypothetical protein